MGDQQRNVVVEAIVKAPASSITPGPGQGDLLNSTAYMPHVRDNSLFMKEEAGLDCAWAGGEVTLKDGDAASSSEGEGDEAVHLMDGQAPSLYALNSHGYGSTASVGGGGQDSRAANLQHCGMESTEEDQRLIIVEEVPDEKFMYHSLASDSAAAGFLLDTADAAIDIDPSADKEHAGSGQIVCDICNKEFRQMNYLKVHMRTHYNIKPYECDVCGKVFSRSSLLSEHKRMHGDNLQYSCEICGKSYRWNSSLHLHMQTHNNRKDFVCTLCNRAFRWRIMLRRHMTMHAKESPYKCEKCQKSFTDSYSLAQHARVHSGERPFVCPDCGRAFRWKHQITQHACAVRNGTAPPMPQAQSATRRRSAPAVATSATPTQAAASGVPQTDLPGGYLRHPDAGTVYGNSEGDVASSYFQQQSATHPDYQSYGTSHAGAMSASDHHLQPGAYSRRNSAPPPVLLSIASQSGIVCTGRLSQLASRRPSHGTSFTANIDDVRHDHVGGEPFISMAYAQARVALASDGQKKLFLTVPQSVMVALLQSHPVSEDSRPVGSPGLVASVPPVSVPSMALPGAGGAAHMSAPLFHLPTQTVPTPDVTLGAPLMLT